MWVKQSQGSEDYRSAQEIFDDCFSISTVSTTAGARKESTDNAAAQLNGKESQIGSGVTETSSQSSRPTSQERRVRSLVLDTRYNRLLLVKSKMSDTNEIIRTNSLPSSRRRSRFK